MMDGMLEGAILVRFLVEFAPENRQTPKRNEFHLPTIYFLRGELLVLSKVVSTHLWNTPLNLYQQPRKGFLSISG